MNLTSLTNLTPTQKLIAIVLASVISFFILLYAIHSVYEWWHNSSYQQQQQNLNNDANTSEANANQHLQNANVFAANRENLENEESNLRNERANQQNRANGDRQNSANSGDAFNRALNQKLPNRTGNASTDDDQLRSDAERANKAFNNR